MKQNLNEHLSAAAASLAHGQSIVVVDYWYPIPADANKIDLSVLPGLPNIEQVVEAITADVQVQEYFLAEQALERNQGMIAYLRKRIPDARALMLPHKDFRDFVQYDRRGSTPRAFVRTGYQEPYGNTMLVQGDPAKQDCAPLLPPIENPNFRPIPE